MIASPTGPVFGNAPLRVQAKDLTPARLKAAGFPEAVRVAESVDWDKLSAWPDERLFMVGTDRQVKEEFSYELKAAV